MFCRNTQLSRVHCKGFRRVVYGTYECAKGYLWVIVRDYAQCDKWVVHNHKYSTVNTGAYSSFKRLRLRPPCAQIPQPQRRSVPVFFRNFKVSLRKPGFCHNFPFSRRDGDRSFTQATGSSVSTSPVRIRSYVWVILGKLPRIVGRAQPLWPETD